MSLLEINPTLVSTNRLTRATNPISPMTTAQVQVEIFTSLAAEHYEREAWSWSPKPHCSPLTLTEPADLSLAAEAVSALL